MTTVTPSAATTVLPSQKSLPIVGQPPRQASNKPKTNFCRKVDRTWSLQVTLEKESQMPSEHNHHRYPVPASMQPINSVSGSQNCISFHC